MRKHFSSYIENFLDQNDDLVFITGDLGYNALENLQGKLGQKFINAGVAEQSMVSVAAGIASQGFRVICYSIAPFAVFRCLEQIRNDICFHNLPVFVVGNGGGYGYGIMGSSHHALEDIACLSGLPNMQCYIPAFIEDLKYCMDQMFENKRPAYLRLGLGKNLPVGVSITDYGAAGKQSDNQKLTVIVQGPIANNLSAALSHLDSKNEVAFFVINKMPLKILPKDVEESISKTNNVLTIEEHIAGGGLGSSVALAANEKGISIAKFVSLHAKGYPNGLYGSQAYHQQLSGLDADNISSVISSFFAKSYV
jgi:transketolase